MEKLSSALRRLRLELEAGLGRDDGAGGPVGTATLTLSLALEPNQPEPAWLLAEPASGQAPLHSVTIQFQLGSGTAPATGMVVPKSAAAPAPAPGQSEQQIVDQCLPIFGPPGFDNAARAEVFCELVTQHARAELNDALDAISRPSTSPSTPSALTSRLRQLLGFAPVGREAAAARLRKLFDQHPPGDIQRIIASRWRFGTHWGAAADGFSV